MSAEYVRGLSHALRSRLDVVSVASASILDSSIPIDRRCPCGVCEYTRSYQVQAESERHIWGYEPPYRSVFWERNRHLVKAVILTIIASGILATAGLL